MFEMKLYRIHFPIFNHVVIFRDQTFPLRVWIDFRSSTFTLWGRCAFNITKLLKELQLEEKDAVAKITLRLPTDSEQILHDKVEGVLVVSQKAVYSFSLPDQLRHTISFKLVLCATYNATFISSGKFHTLLFFW